MENLTTFEDFIVFAKKGCEDEDLNILEEIKNKIGNAKSTFKPLFFPEYHFISDKILRNDIKKDMDVVNNLLKNKMGSNQILNFDKVIKNKNIFVDKFGMNLLMNIIVSYVTKRITGIRQIQKKNKNKQIEKINNYIDLSSYEPLNIYYTFNYYNFNTKYDKCQKIIDSLKVLHEKKYSSIIKNQRQFFKIKLKQFRDGKNTNAVTIIKTHLDINAKFLALYQHCFESKGNFSKTSTEFPENFNPIAINLNSQNKQTQVKLLTPIKYYKKFREIKDDDSLNEKQKKNKAITMRNNIMDNFKFLNINECKITINEYEKQNNSIGKINVNRLEKFKINNDNDKKYLYCKISKYITDNLKQLNNIKDYIVDFDKDIGFNIHKLYIKILKKDYNDINRLIKCLNTINNQILTKYNLNKTLVINNLIKNDIFTNNGQMYEYNTKKYNGIVLYRTKLMEDNPLKLLAVIILVSKLNNRIIELTRTKRDRKDEYKTYESTEKRKSMKQKYNRLFNERINENKTNWVKHMLPEEREKYLQKNKLFARQYRKSLQYKLYLKQRKLYAKSRKLSELRRLATKHCCTYNLDDAYVQQLIESNCSFCGKSVEPKTYDMSYICRDNIDRGYVKDNVLPVCSLCCIMKGSYLAKDLKKIIAYIGDTMGYIKLKNKSKYDCYFVGKYSINFNPNYNRYRYGAEKRNIIFNLTNKEFTNLINDKNCHYCNNLFNKIGVDRINSFDKNGNKLPYNINNCVSACKTCNYVKREIDYNEFISQIKKICKFMVKK